MTDLLTPAEAARLVGVSTKTLARWAKAGHVRDIRTLGNTHRYDAEELLDLRDRVDGVDR